MSGYRTQFIEAKRAYKDKDYEKAYEIYTELYGNAPFDNSAKYSYAWAIYQSRIKDYTSKEQLLKDAELVSELTKQHNLNYTKLCVYTMSVMKVIRLLYYDRDYDDLPHWLEKINPDYLDQARYRKDDEVYPSNMEHYYVWASVTYLNLGEYEKCIKTTRAALSKLNKFTGNNGDFFMWRLAKSLRQIGDYEQALKFLNILQLDEWYVQKEIAENYYYLGDDENCLKHALKAAIKDGPMDMKFNLYNLLSELLFKDYPDWAEKHEDLYEMIREEDNEGKGELEYELNEFWKKLLAKLS